MQHITQVWDTLAHSVREDTEVVTPKSCPKSIAYQLFIIEQVKFELTME